MIWPVRRSRAALGLAPASIPVSLYILLGVALGPRLLNVVSDDVLAHLDAAVSVTLATIGVFIGIAFASQGRRERRVLLAAAGLESLVTIAVVAVAIRVLLWRWTLPSTTNPWLVSLVLGACAAASSAGTADGAPAGDRLASTVADLDDVLPVVVGAAVLGLDRPNGWTPGTQLLLTVAIGLVCGLIGWLLFERADNVGERGVFVLGTLVLMGGATAYLALSPLLAGLVCGAFWRLVPGRADDIVGDDLRRYHHPLVFLLMLCAGAEMAPRLSAVWLFAPLVLFRLTGKLIGGALASRVHESIAAAALGAYLIPPGVVGVALALNFYQIGGDEGAIVTTAVAAAAVVFELIALAVGGGR